MFQKFWMMCFPWIPSEKTKSVYLSLIKLPYVSRQINMTCDEHSISFLA